MTNVRQGPSELLALLDRRWNEEVKDLPDTYRAPPMTEKRRSEIEVAAIAHAQADHSNPFAWGRVRLHMKRGIEEPAKVRAAAFAALSARVRVGVYIPAVTK